MASQAAATLDLLRALTLLRDLRRETHQAVDRPGIFTATLGAAVRLLRAAGGGVAMRDPATGELRWARRGDAPAWGPLDDPEVRALLEGEADPPVAGPPTACLLAPLRWGGAPRLGALAVEAPAGAAFDDRDRDVLRLLAGHAASDCESVDKALGAAEWAEALRPDAAPAEVAARLVREARRRFGLAGALAYKVIHRAGLLLSLAGDSDSRPVDEVSPSVYHTDDPSAAVWAYTHGRGKVWPRPHGDPEVNQDGLKDFDIRGPLFAVPLRDGTETVGVLVTWLPGPAADEAELSRVLEGLEALADAAARRLRVALSAQAAERRRRLQDGVARVLKQMMFETDRARNLGAVLEAVQGLGFDRVRVYEFRYGDSFRGPGVTRHGRAGAGLRGPHAASQGRRRGAAGSSWTAAGRI